MSFSKIIEEAAFFRSGGKCECRRESCGHPLPHGAPVSRPEARFRHHISPETEEEKLLDNCQVLCPHCYHAASNLPSPASLGQDPAGKGLAP
jgi:hypothetical protein